MATATAHINNVAVFISHGSKDAELAEAVVELLRASLEIAATQIRCSSVDGYRLPVGVNTDRKLREEVNAATVVVGLITPSSLASYYVMFELGARWGTGLFFKELADAIPPNEELAKHNRTVEIEKDLEYVHDGGFYVRKSEQSQGKNIPYCPTCWASDEKLVPLNPGTGKGHYSCDIHKSNHETERYRNYLKQMQSQLNRRSPWS